MHSSAAWWRGLAVALGMLALSITATPAADQPPACKELSPTLAQATPISLAAMVVIGNDDETLGRVEAVVRNTRTARLDLVLRTNGGERLRLGVGCIEAVDAQLRLTYSLPEETLRERIAAFEPDEHEAVPVATELGQLNKS